MKLTDDQVLELSTKIQQLRSADADVETAKQDLLTRTATRDKLRADVAKLKGEPVPEPDTTVEGLRKKLDAALPVAGDDAAAKTKK